ncbi:hypothetical protein AP053_gp006 [Ostreococcus mediterraneus virus 1]|uniref:hypothetical protein n=1 Tax=Ostreococcus mediterraneus virus 1 TaxID=1663210 RepID=UPI0006D2B6AD|nr:hypothetical protein AP053_gp006 [Ostreococcus mediterraneus virus 1]ALI95117.1 hypothetical protein OmV1_006c [Ostreococcus mediterraneus virus 1]
MSAGAIIAVGALGVMVCCSASSVAAVMMGGDGESNVGKVCTPQGTPDPNATYKYGANDTCVMTCKTGYKKKDGACVESSPSGGSNPPSGGGNPPTYSPPTPPTSSGGYNPPTYSPPTPPTSSGGYNPPTYSPTNPTHVFTTNPTHVFRGV